MNCDAVSAVSPDLEMTLKRVRSSFGSEWRQKSRTDPK